MAIPLYTAIPNEVGKVIFRKAGRFVSKNEFLRESRRLGKGLKRGGQFLSRAEHALGLSESGLARQMMAEVGPPIGGGNWVSRVKKSAERFTDMLAGNNALG